MRKTAAVLGSIILIALTMAISSAAANGATITVGDGVITEIGTTTTVSLTLDKAPKGLSGYIMTVSLSDPTTLTNQRVSGASVWMKAVDLTQKVEAGATNIDLGTLTVKGDAEGECTFNVAIGRVEDDDGNLSIPAIVSGTLRVDTTPPTVGISDDEPGTANIAGGDVTYTFDFSETVTGFDASDVTVANGTKGTFTAVSGTQYTLAVTPTPNFEGNLTVDVAADVAVDTAGNGNTAATQSVQAVDTLAPTLVLVSFTVTLAADPINLLADGVSTSTLTATVKDAEGHNVADGTPVSFTTDRGILGSSTITKTTTNGAATATLTAPTERGIATVQAQSDNVSDYTAVFFKERGQPDVVAAKTESTEPGTDTVDAKDEANTTVTKSGVGTPAITVAQYEENPGSSPITAFFGGYIAVHLDDTTNVDEVTICLYYPIAVDESKVRLYWWDEAASAWVLTNPQTKNTTDIDDYGGKVCIAVRATGTIPTLDDLQGTVFFAGVDGPD
jgi:hypothetical protein